MGRLEDVAGVKDMLPKLLDLLIPKDATFLLLLQSSYDVIAYILKRIVGSCPDMDFDTCWVSQREMSGEIIQKAPLCMEGITERVESFSTRSQRHVSNFWMNFEGGFLVRENRIILPGACFPPMLIGNNLLQLSHD
ncbi:hypothetical protein NL676_010865 [Syzygium grande]|nr:hypothetical protein NL676_010865 [Syzygium grande]